MAKSRPVMLLLNILVLGSLCMGETVPSTYFGMQINRSKTSWPNVGFGSYRLWDDGTAWANINTSMNVYNWSPLDTWVNNAEQHNVELLYTFGRTPLWASSNPSKSCNYGNGQCVAPSDYTYWDRFVTALVTRYKGKIKYYEMWNEPNDTGFWQGTTAQMVEMTRRGANIIHSVDPDAQVVSPGATWKSTTAWAWLDEFLTAGGGRYLDDIGFHGYTGNNKGDGILTIIDHVQDTQNAHGLSLPMLVTEGGWGLNTVIPSHSARAAFLAQRYLLITSRPSVKSLYWYQWDSQSWGTLWDSGNGIHEAGRAYGHVSEWLTGADANGCDKSDNATWVCNFTLANGESALAVWNATSSLLYTPGAQFTMVLGIDGSSKSINGGAPFLIGNAPVLFTARSFPATSVSLSVSPWNGVAPVTVGASVSTGIPSGLTTKSTAIEFGDGTAVNAPTASHTYTAAGSYTIVATVMDSMNRTTTATEKVTVSPGPIPAMALSVSPASGTVPLMVSAKATGGTTASVINFGDGTIVNGTTATHVYKTAGKYNVIATPAKGGAGAAAIVNAMNSNPPAGNKAPVAIMSLTKTAGVSYRVSSAASYDPDGTIALAVINWGDGSRTNARSGTHTYPRAGSYPVTVTVTDKNGASASTSATATPAWGIFVVSPRSSSTVGSPVHVVASAAAPVPIIATKIMVDGKTEFSGSSWNININLRLASGTRNMIVQATDRSGTQYKTSLSIHVN